MFILFKNVLKQQKVAQKNLFFTSLPSVRLSSVTHSYCLTIDISEITYLLTNPWSRGRGFDSNRGTIRATTLGKLFTPK